MKDVNNRRSFFFLFLDQKIINGGRKNKGEGNITRKMESGKRNLSGESPEKRLVEKKRTDSKPGQRVKNQSSNNGKAHIVPRIRFSLFKMALIKPFSKSV